MILLFYNRRRYMGKFLKVLCFFSFMFLVSSVNASPANDSFLDDLFSSNNYIGKNIDNNRIDYR